MKKPFVLNFWTALLVLLIVKLIVYLPFTAVVFIIGEKFHNSPFQISLAYYQILIYVPFIVWLAKKTETKIKRLYLIPTAKTLLWMIAVVLLARFFIFELIPHGNGFWQMLTEGQLKVTVFSLRPIFPLQDLRMIIIIPIIEELFFRGLVLKQFLKKYSPINAILLSSLLFSAYHLELDRFVFLFFLGVLFALIFYISKSLTLSTLAHMIWNATAIFMYNNIGITSRNIPIIIFIYVIAFGLMVVLLKNRLKGMTWADWISVGTKNNKIVPD